MLFPSVLVNMPQSAEHVVALISNVINSSFVVMVRAWALHSMRVIYVPHPALDAIAWPLVASETIISSAIKAIIVHSSLSLF